MSFRPDYGDKPPGGDVTGYIHHPGYAVDAAKAQAELGGREAAEIILGGHALGGQLTADGRYIIDTVGSPSLAEHEAKVAAALQNPEEYLD